MLRTCRRPSIAWQHCRWMPDGFRGALLLRAGNYRLASSLRIRASGIVLRGEGMGDTGTILTGTGNWSPLQPRVGPGPAGDRPRW